MTTEDRCAIDLILENRANGSATSWSAECFQKSAGAKLRHRVETIERVLGLLSEMPVADPPANLVARTMRKIEKEGHRRPMVVPQGHISAPAHPRPVANRHVH